MNLDALRCALAPVLADPGQRGSDLELSACANNASRVSPGSIFCAVKGAHADGHDYLDEADRNGAAAFVVAAARQGPLPQGKPVLRVTDSYLAWAILCEEFANRPADAFRVHTVTGTNGKTSVAFILRHLFAAAGRRTGLITTVLTDTGDGQARESTSTMPDAETLQKVFAEMKGNAVEDAVTESSSHGIHQHRAGSLFFASAVFTNLTGDHLDYHKTMENYYQAKKLLFTEMLAPDAPCVINTGDAHGLRLSRELAECGIAVRTFSDSAPAFCRLLEFRPLPDGSTLRFELDGLPHELRIRLRGEHNAANLLESLTSAYASGLPLDTLLAAAESAPPAPGRLEPFRLPNGATAFVDYAHTDDALFRVLTALRKLLPPGGRLLTVFGCGGDRDRTKRPRMGRVASEYSDFCFITSDNPRSESPEAIIEEIRQGIPAGRSCKTIPDRAEAIACAVRDSHPGDILLIAGKGHETYQEIAGVKHPFDDRRILSVLCGK